MDRVIQRYGKALFLFAQEKAEWDVVLEQLMRIKKELGVNPELRLFFSSPAFGRDLNKKTLEELAKAWNLHGVVKAFLLLLCHGGRLSFFDKIVDHALFLHEKKAGVARGVLTSVVPLESRDKERLEEMLSKKTGKRILLENRIDQGLWGGFVLQLGVYRLDTSLKAKIQWLKTCMKGLY